MAHDLLQEVAAARAEAEELFDGSPQLLQARGVEAHLPAAPLELQAAEAELRRSFALLVRGVPLPAQLNAMRLAVSVTAALSVPNAKSLST